MKSLKLVLGLVVALVATGSAIASVKAYRATNAFYIVGTVGQSDENCISFTTQKTCVIGGSGCTDFISTSIGVKQLYATRTAIGATGRFHCSNELQEQ